MARTISKIRYKQQSLSTKLHTLLGVFIILPIANTETSVYVQICAYNLINLAAPAVFFRKHARLSYLQGSRLPPSIVLLVHQFDDKET